MHTRHLLLPALLVLLSPALLAHGGQYRGGWNTPPSPPGGGPAGGGPGAPAPLTGARPNISDGTSWQVWWEFNKDPLLAQVAGDASQPITGSDEYYLGKRLQRLGPAPQALDNDHLDRIAEALVKALASTNNRDVTTAAMIALAKLGRGPKGVDIEKLFEQRLADGDQEVREAAALALGIAGQQHAFSTLIELLRDSPAGRKLAGHEVSDRSRTFAAWSLGLLASRATDPSQKVRIRDALLEQLADKNLVSRDLRVGLIEGLGLLGHSLTGADKLLAWQTVASLWAYYDQDLGKGDQLIQAHVPIAVARLLGRGDSVEHQRTKERLIGELFSIKKRNNAILQSAAMALGTMCEPPDGEHGDVAACAALARYYKDGSDQLTRFFSALALGRIGGAENRTTLLKLWNTANRSIERPWLAISLGLLAREQARADHGKVDEEVGRLLQHDFEQTTNDDTMSAMAMGIGLTGYVDAAVVMAPRLDEINLHWQVIGYVSLSLAMLEQRQFGDKLLALLEKHKRIPFIVQQAAIALGRLGDPRVVPTLQKLLDESESTAVLSSIVNALALVGDRRSVDPLITTLQDKDRPLLARAFAAAALGSIADKDPLPWNTAIAVGMNYMATVDTLTNGSSGILDIL